MHLVLALCTAMVIFSPFVTGEGDPAFPALMIVPIGAALMSGVRAGAIWSILITAVLAIYASQYPFPESVRKLVWLSAIMAAGGGLAATLIESARERARKGAEAAALVRELAESALVESQALFELAFRSSTAILSLISLETGKILDVNKTFTRIGGWSHAEAVGKSLGELNAWIGPDDRQQIFDQLMAKGGIDAVELQMRSKHGDLVWLRGSAETLQQQGRACLLVEMADVTEAKRNNEALKRYRVELEERYAERGEQLQESREQLRQLDRLAAVGTLAAGVAHQINNPIGGIVAAAEFAAVMDDEPDRETIRTEALATALNEAKRCGRIVKNILKFSRDEPTVKWAEDLTSIVVGATELARTHVIKQGGRLDMNVAVCPLPILASTIDIEQVVLNLIYNASESKLDGADVIVETALHGEFAEISVSDNGAGIDPDRRPYIFEPFYTSRVDQGGSGLGLSVVHGIVADHGGKLEIDDVPTGGTRVRVLLPLSTDASNPTG